MKTLQIGTYKSLPRLSLVDIASEYTAVIHKRTHKSERTVLLSTDRNHADKGSLLSATLLDLGTQSQLKVDLRLTRVSPDGKEIWGLESDVARSVVLDVVNSVGTVLEKRIWLSVTRKELPHDNFMTDDNVYVEVTDNEIIKQFLDIRNKRTRKRIEKMKADNK